MNHAQNRNREIAAFIAEVLPVPDGFEQVQKEWEAGKVSLEEAQKRLGMTETTFYRRRREYRLLHPLKKESS